MDPAVRVGRRVPARASPDRTSVSRPPWICSSLTYSPTAKLWLGLDSINLPVCGTRARQGDTTFGGTRHPLPDSIFSRWKTAYAVKDGLSACQHRARFASLGGHKGSVNQIAFTPNGQTLATVDDDTIRLFRCRHRKRPALPRDGSLTAIYRNGVLTSTANTCSVE